MTDTTKLTLSDEERHKATIDVAMEDLNAAASPTKCEVFTSCGVHAADLRDAIIYLRASLEEAEGRLTQVAGNDVWWKTVIGEGETHQQTGEISVKHLHPLTVKPIYEAHKGTVIADVIAGLIFNLAITTNREQFLVSDALDRVQAAIARAEKAEQQRDAQRETLVLVQQGLTVLHGDIVEEADAAMAVMESAVAAALTLSPSNSEADNG